MSEPAMKKSPVRDIIQTTELTVTTNTAKWMDHLHQCGATFVTPSGEVQLHPKVREIVTALHTVLAGGNVTITSDPIDSTTFEALESKFELAFKEAKTAVEARTHMPRPVSPYVP